jgi:nucleotide-binding universal stress UspA family protein
MLSRFRHVLAPVDLSAANRAALEIVFEIAAQNHARVTLLHVIETLDVDDEADVRELYEQLERRARSELEPLRHRFADAGVNVHAAVVLGKRTREIVEFAAEHGVDLIVMSSHPIDAAHPVQSLATISYQVSIAASCSVLLVKTPPIVA